MQTTRWPLKPDWKIRFEVPEATSRTRARESKMYFRWWADKLWTFVPAQGVVGQFVGSFKEFPPSQPSATFGPDQALEMLSKPGRAN